MTPRVLCLSLVLAGCVGETASPWRPDVDGSVGRPDPLELPPCEDPLETCEGDGCPAPPSEVTHAEWYARLTASPPITWSGGGPAIQLSVGSEPGETDVFCWTDAEGDAQHTFRALDLVHGRTYYVNARSVEGEVASTAISSTGWTVDVRSPPVPDEVRDARGPTTGEITWTATEEDALSGFAGYRVAVGSEPGGDDVLPWTELPPGTSAYDVSSLDLPVGVWHYVSVQTVDVAGAGSQPAVSAGYMRCPDNFVFVPRDETEELGTGAFCLAQYEMRVQGSDDGNVTFDGSQVAESRPTGTPWVNMEPDVAEVACATMGEGYHSMTNVLWQAVARSIEANPLNWSGGEVGMGFVSRGHSDQDPTAVLPASADDPCFMTGNPSCEDPASPDWAQNRTHLLSNDGVVWDFAGNVWEAVTGSMGGPDTLWTSYDASYFTEAERAEEWRTAFAPLGPYTEEQGMGRMYGGTGKLYRGGASDGYSRGTAGSAGILDMGIYAAHHNAHSFSTNAGFRCVYQP